MKWPWLVQVGSGRVGFYSYDLLDSLGRASAEEVRPQLQQLDVGDVAAPMANPPTEDTSFRVHELVSGRTLVWAKPHSSWALTPAGTCGTRLVTRLRQQYTAHPSTLLTVLPCEFRDFPMMRKMLLGLKRSAEQHTPALPAASERTGGDHDRPQPGTEDVAPAVPGSAAARSPRHKNDGSEQT